MPFASEYGVLVPILVTTLISTLGVGVGAHGGAWSGLVAQVFDPTWNTANRSFIWAAIVIVLFLSGFGFPMPEDVPLALSGFTTTKQAGDTFVWGRFLLTFMAVTLPILAGDLVAYSLGRRFGFGLRDRNRFIGRALTDKRMARVKHWFHEYGSFTVFLGRQVAGVRFVTFYTAGVMHMPVLRFVFFDFLGCLVSIPIWLMLGYFAAIFGKAWLDVVGKRVSIGFLVGGLLGIGILVLLAKIRNQRRKQNEPSTTSTATTESNG